MIKEYHFAALLYDEEEKTVRCAACGKPVKENKCLYKTGGRWTCGKCTTGFGDAPTEAALCATVAEAVRN